MHTGLQRHPCAGAFRPVPALTAESLAHCRTRLIGFKVSSHSEFRGELPKTPIGKALRRGLREGPPSAHG